MIVSTIKMTSRQYRELGEDPAGVRLELVDGQVAVGPGILPLHSHVNIHLVSLIVEHLGDAGSGGLYLGIDVIFDAHNVRRPDISYFRSSRQHMVAGYDVPAVAPDLCVEIISPTSGEIDRKDKFLQYAKAGVRFYWIVDPDLESIEGYGLGDGGYVQAGRATGKEVIALPPFPEMKIPLARLWWPTQAVTRTERRI